MNTYFKIIFSFFWGLSAAISHAIDVSGSWDSSYGLVTLSQNGNAVNGDYAYDGGLLTGALTGNIFYGWWSEAGNTKSCGPDNQWSGLVVFKFSDDSNAFTGSWGYCSSSHDSLDPDGRSWTGTRQNTVTPTPTPTPASTPIATPTPFPTPTVAPTPAPVDSSDSAVEIINSSGDVIIASTANVNITGDNSQSGDAVAIVTPSQTETTVVIDNASIKVKANTVFLTHPKGSDTSPLADVPVATLIRGEVQPEINCSVLENFTLHTLLADIFSQCSSQRNSNNPEFTANYSQNGLDGALTVSVISGSVSVTDRNGDTSIVSAGESKTIHSVVNRSTWVLPIDNDKIYGGQQNLFVWSAYPGAAGYILEYNVSPQFFSEDNPQSIEYHNQAITLRPSDYDNYDDLILFNVFIGAATAKLVAQGRIFAIDSAGNIISGTLSSDKISVDWE